ncbi:GlxA family transcriptional regulator [Maritimibacter sp. DP1N21-5]|uniref:GlxA family transcriptional regulator n=1 Tax=Maritimibacter sp. DP1N21-5 TaxID=2836867 RepID=UPI001C47147D|nr:GlxA family transcriptional regulator [Maritimibacter sp. DP1N21-5]MBV7409930.1 GlxA family transcriptional regulator [Maritimibacter sp. DP1N21-5]
MPPLKPAPNPGPDAVRRFVFVLMKNFTLLSFAGAVDALRLANRQLGYRAYDWRVVGEGGVATRCSAGTVVNLDGDLDELRHDDTVILCGGIDVGTATTQKLVSWLRRETRRGVRVGALCTATHALAKAGLLDGKRATIHWENHDAFLEDFPDVDLAKSIFVIDGKTMTTAGGTSSIDLMLAIIARDHGQDVANSVADQQIYTSIRTDRDNQRLSVPTRIGVRHPKLATVIQRMETTIEEPVSPSLLAEEVGLSTRQLERLFRRYLNRSPKRYYMELRLARARNLLMQTEMNVINVALACGFTSPSHFSKCYRAQYGTTPYRERGSHEAAEGDPDDGTAAHLPMDDDLDDF